MERSADSFISDPPHALELCRQLGLADELNPTSESGRRALVVRAGRLVPVPDGFVIMSPRRLAPLLRSPILSFQGKLRLLEEPLVPPRSPTVTDESVADFARRRWGAEVYDRLIQPLVGGIYTGDPERLSMAATMPKFWEAEVKHGSLLRGARAARGERIAPEASKDHDQTSGARYSMFLAPRGGMGTIARALADALPQGTIRLHQRVTAVRQVAHQWQVTLAVEKSALEAAFDALILAVPAPVAAGLLFETNSQLADCLGGIATAGAVVVSVGYRQEQVAHSFEAFGFVVPHVEGRQILACSFLSRKFAHRAPEGSISVRVFLGGALQSELVNLPDHAVQTIVERELRDLLGVSGPPQVVDIARWYGAMPQYHVGHLQRVDEIERLVQGMAGLALAGNAYRGVGIAQCVRGGDEAALRVFNFLRNRHVAG
jgi:oxygen-dependent protoporphyrinogen oxidase